MRLFKLLTIAVLLISVLGFLAACKKDDGTEPSLNDLTKMSLLNGGRGWVLGTVIKDDYDVTDQYTGFKLTFGNGTYTVENSTGNAWPLVEGAWVFSNEDGIVIIRDGSTTIQLTKGEGTLSLQFTVGSSDNGGRTASVEGQYVFNLVSE